MESCNLSILYFNAVVLCNYQVKDEKSESFLNQHRISNILLTEFHQGFYAKRFRVVL